MHHSATPPTITPVRPAPAQPLLRTDVRGALQHGIPRLQAQGILIEALDELHMGHINDADPHQPEQFHQAFVLILRTAKTLHTTAEEAVLEHMTHALRTHYTRHDRVAHALVSAWSAVELSDPAGLVLDLLDVLASDAAPLPFWVSHLLHLLPRTGLSSAATESLRQVRLLLKPRLDELAPARLSRTLQRLEADPDLHGLQQLVGDLGLLALEQSPSEGLTTLAETPPHNDGTLVWFSHQHPGRVLVSATPCDDHWLTTPLGQSALDRLLALCSQMEAGPARRLRRQVLYQYAHAARLALERPEHRHPCLMVAQIHRIAQTLDTPQDANRWAEVLAWLAPQRSAEPTPAVGASAQCAVFDALLLPSFDKSPLLVLRTVLDAQIDPTLWLPGVVRNCMDTQSGLSRLLTPLQQLQRPRAQA
jgi:hypothetical protein